VLLAAVIYMSPVVILLLASWAMESATFSRIARLFGSANRWPGYCSFCRQSYRDVGPLAEGPDDVYICGNCAQSCGQLIEAERKRLGSTEPPILGQPQPVVGAETLDHKI